jgi:uncharacterized protein (DUF58 family)
LGFSTGVEKYVAAKKGKKHVLRIIREKLYHKQKDNKTDISNAMVYLSHILKKRSTVFVISDFYDGKNFSNALKVLKHHNDVVAVVLRDRRDAEIPDMGYFPFYDPETCATSWVDTSDKKSMEKFKKDSKRTDDNLFKTFKSMGIDSITLHCGEPFINNLVSFFKMRERRRIAR